MSSIIALSMGKILLEIPVWYNFSDKSLECSSESYTNGAQRRISFTKLTWISLKSKALKELKKTFSDPQLETINWKFYQINSLGKKMHAERAKEPDHGPAVTEIVDVKTTAYYKGKVDLFLFLIKQISENETKAGERHSQKS